MKSRHRPRTVFRHVLDRYDLWDQVAKTPPKDEFGPLVNLGLLQLMQWSTPETARAFIRSCSWSELATFIALLAAIGPDVVEKLSAELEKIRQVQGPRNQTMPEIRVTYRPAEQCAIPG